MTRKGTGAGTYSGQASMADTMSLEAETFLAPCGPRGGRTADASAASACLLSAMKGKSLLLPGANFFHSNAKTLQTTSFVSRNASIPVRSSPLSNWPTTCYQGMYTATQSSSERIGELMRLSKLSLLGALATLALSSLSAHADSLSLGSTGQSMSFTFYGDHESGSGGNYTPSSAVIGGKTVNFDAVYCVDLNDFINDNSF